MLEANIKNYNFLETVVDVATVAGHLLTTKKIHIEGDREMNWAIVEIAEAFQAQLNGFDYNEQDDAQKFRCYVEEIDDFAEKELTKRYPLEEGEE